MDEELERKIIEAYKKGWKITRIEAELGVTAAVVYAVLDRHKIVKNRIQRKVRYAVDGKTAQQWLARITEQEDTIAALEDERRQLSTMVAERDSIIQKLRKLLDERSDSQQ